LSCLILSERSEWLGRDEDLAGARLVDRTEDLGEERVEGRVEARVEGRVEARVEARVEGRVEALFEGWATDRARDEALFDD